MSRKVPFNLVRMIAVAAIVSMALPVASQEPPSKDADAKPEKEAALSDAEKQARRAAERFVDTIELEQLSDDMWTKVKRIEKPLLYFSDETRGHQRGSVWAWGEKGRPAAVLELWQGAAMQGKFFMSSLCNTSGRKVRASRGGNSWWLENQSDVLAKDIPQAPAGGRRRPAAASIEASVSEIHGPRIHGWRIRGGE